MLSDIKILIIEDKKAEAEAIKEGLLMLQDNKIADKFIDTNIIEYIVDKDSNIVDIRMEISTKIFNENIDVLFIDLHLINNVNDGISLIQGLMRSDKIVKYIPKYIISSDETVKEDEKYEDALQYAFFIHKGNSDANKFKEKFSRLRLIETLPILVSMYREVKELNDIDRILKNLEYKLDDIKEDTASIKSKVNLIESMNLTMIKLFPLAIPNEKQKSKFKEIIEKDMSIYLDVDFKKDFFPLEFNKANFVKSVSDEFKKTVESDLKKGAWDIFKDCVKEIAKTQGIEDDNAALCAAKLTYRGYGEISNFIKGNTDI